MNISLRKGRSRIMAVNSKDFMIKVNTKKMEYSVSVPAWKYLTEYFFDHG